MRGPEKIFSSLAGIVLFLGALSSSCDDQCTRTLKITNTGSDSLIVATKLLGSDPSTCKLVPLDIVTAYESGQIRLRHCWRGELEAANFELFVVNPAQFNEGHFYGCDSIEVMNDILSYRNLTAADIPSLEVSGFELLIP